MNFDFEKIHFVESFSESGDQNIFSIGKDRDLIKVASSVDPEIQIFIDELKPEKTRRYILINALGAMEYYGSNINGDAFPEASLAHRGPDYGYKTFENYGFFYRDHNNKDPKNKIGDIHLSIYNPRMHRIELVASIIAAKAPQLIAKIDNGEYFLTSMGSKNPFDTCSICGNKATKLSEHCEHVRMMRNKILPDGRKVCMINPYPRFHDISHVGVPAEMTSKMLKKIASVEIDVSKLGQQEKKSEIDKEIMDGRVISGSDNEIATSIARNAEDISSRDSDMDPKILKALSKFPIEKVLATLTAMAVPLKPAEFVKLSGMNTNKIFVPMRVGPGEFKLNIGHENFDDDVAKIAATILPERSYHDCYFIDRMSSGLSKVASHPEYASTPELNKLSFLFGAYNAQAPLALLENPFAIAVMAIFAMGALSGIHRAIYAPERFRAAQNIYSQPIQPARVIPLPIPQALMMSRAYYPFDKNASSDILNVIKRYRINFSDVCEKATNAHEYVNGISKVASVNFESINPDMCRWISMSYLMRKI